MQVQAQCPAALLSKQGRAGLCAPSRGDCKLRGQPRSLPPAGAHDQAAGHTGKTVPGSWSHRRDPWRLEKDSGTSPSPNPRAGLRRGPGAVHHPAATIGGPGRSLEPRVGAGSVRGRDRHCPRGDSRRGGAYVREGVSIGGGRGWRRSDTREGARHLSSDSTD